MARTAILSDYIKDCHFDDPSLQRIFDQGITHRPPTLSKDRMNRILIYPGAFNPPHVGHQELLRQAFYYSRDINVIAAIIVPMDDQYVREKALISGDCLVFTREERVKLWRDWVPHDWYWVYDRSEREWASFRERLTTRIHDDGFEVEFVVVLGPDHYKLDSSPFMNGWHCLGVISSDVCRQPTFRITDTQLLESGPWKHAIWNYAYLCQYVEEAVAFGGGVMALTALSVLEENLREDKMFFDTLKRDIHLEEVDRLKQVRICYRQGHPEQWFRFIPSKRAERSRMNSISSTEIRRTLRNYPKGDIVSRLEGMVLHPEILAEIMAVKRDGEGAHGAGVVGERKQRIVRLQRKV